MTALNTPIVFNNSTGSDTAASGSPSTRSTPTVLNLMILSGSNYATGSHSGPLNAGDLVYIPSMSSGIKFNVLSSITQGGSGNQYNFDSVWTATNTSATGYSGGKRATFDNADSRHAIFNSQDGWIFETETDQSLTSSIPCPYTNGKHYFRGSEGSKKTITQTVNDGTFDGNGNNNAINHFQNLKFDNTASTKTSAVALHMRRRTVVVDCIFGDATNKLLTGWTRLGDFPSYYMKRCVVEHCTSTNGGWGIGGPTLANATAIQCIFRNNDYTGLLTGQSPTRVINCLFHDNGTSGMSCNIGSSRDYTIQGCVFYGNGGDGIGKSNSSDWSDMSTVENNIFVSNGGYGINRNNVASWVADSNAYYDNTSGNTNLSNLNGPNDITLTADPFVDAANNDFNINASGGATLRSTNYTLGG